MTIWRVIPDEVNAQRGRLVGPCFDEMCALGKNGVIPEAEGQEGDGKTPSGIYPFRHVFFRPDREQIPITRLSTQASSPSLGWCDAPESKHYNKLVRLPHGEGHEKLWRDDHLYDLILVIGHNDDPVVSGLGSAIFVHVARDGFRPTLGCVALEVSALRKLLRLIEPEDQLKIG